MIWKMPEDYSSGIVLFVLISSMTPESRSPIKILMILGYFSADGQLQGIILFQNIPYDLQIRSVVIDYQYSMFFHIAVLSL